MSLGPLVQMTNVSRGGPGRVGSLSYRTGIMAVLASLAGASSACAATINVDVRNDVVSSTDGHCSLREAVTAANTDTASGTTAGECPRGDAGGDVVVLAAGDPYVLTTANGGALRITSSLTISGPGAANTTIDAGATSRVLDVGASPAAAVSGVTITGGRAPDGTAPASSGTGGSGGGIRNGGVLTLADVTVRANRAGSGLAGSNDPAIGHPGSPGGAGGGIYNTGTLTLIRTTVADNTAGAGG
ncbi:MAG: fibronectin-binding autotransporter adhesin, partial [Baekduia sp.]|nr:fibronectin-binding autotransporter adhesin [Baekduia sp.]